MCGLGGIAGLGMSGMPPGAEELLRRMLATLAHRGPDAERIRMCGPVGMAFTRLSLVDVEGGSQPLTNCDSSITLIANGEIYNHRDLAAKLAGFVPRTRSDCEVLIGLYERHHLSFLDEVRGIFSFALHDANRNTLVLASDPFATKPMYYYRGAREVIFGSEIKALFDWPSTPRCLDWAGALRDQGVSNRVMMTAQPANTWFEGIQRVEGGTIVTIHLSTGDTEVCRYWQPAQPLTGGDLPSPAEFIGRYRELLYSAVEDSLMSEVELGLFLSGGIDSAAIAAIACDYGQRLHTFTAATGSTLANGDVINARRTASVLGLANSLAVFDATTIPSPDDWRSLLWLLETPLTGAEQYYKYQLYRAAKQVRPGVKAVLLGAGADEFNGGYSEILATGGTWPEFVQNLTRLDPGTDAALQPWVDGELGRLVDPQAIAEYGGGGTSDPYWAFVLWKWRDVQQYNCWHEDRTAAGNGIEARVPFLDRRLVDLATSVPPSMRATLLWDKHMARESVGSTLPEDLRLRTKQPFFHGPAAHFAYRTLLAMLVQNDRELVRQALSAPGAQRFLRPAAIHGALDLMAGGSHQDQVDMVLRLTNLGLLELAAQGSMPPFEASQVTLRAVVRAEPDDAEFQALFDEAFNLDTVFEYAATARLLYEARGDLWHLSIDGVLHFEIAAATEPEWIALLGAIDGERSLAELLQESQADLNRVRGYLELCIDSGFLMVRSRSALREGMAMR